MGFADFDAQFRQSSEIAFTDRSDVTDAVSISWDFGEGSSSTERNPVHRYLETGTYLVRQTIDGPRGTVTHARRVFVGGDAELVQAEYFENDQQSTPAAVRNERSLQFDWSVAPPAPQILDQQFTARFAVAVTPRFSETYRFNVRSPDRVRVMLDGKALIDAWEPGETDQTTASIVMTAGHSYALTVEYEKNSDAPSLIVTWESESQATLVVPRSVSTPKRRAATHP